MGRHLLNYIARRISLLIPTLILVSFMVFGIIRLIPGDVIELMVAEQGYADDEQALKELLGFDESIVKQYWHYMQNVLRGDLGTSLWSGEPVLDEIARRFPVSISLACMALFWTVLVGVLFGVLSALFQDTWLDYALRIYAIGWLSIPSFWVAIMVVVLASVYLGWVPSLSYIPFTRDPIGNLSQLLVPSLILSLALSAGIMRMTRTMMLEVLREDYIRTARAKGLSQWTVVVRHALKNAMIPVITIMGLQLAFLFGGTIIMEHVFQLPGMGSYMLEAITWRDYPAIQGIVLFIATALMAINLIVDLLYGLFDPKVRYS